MKPSLVPIACGTVLALMAGASAAHWCSVRDMVKLAGVMPPHPPASSRPQLPSPSRLPDEGPSREAKEFLARARDGAGRSAPQASPSERPRSASSNSSPVASFANTDVRIEKLLQLLEGTVEENRRLRDSQAETNRDLMELQFRVDMYDGEFRPLKVEEEATPFDDGSGGLGVLPPLE
ncbi:hypothetical protein OKA05_16320 [Luteolibacter arcticus]|uniref:Uncharacterized protein n=1 Tax=Luteolibacter arcticus TaxID=1581411 RepID=A0ABT3GKT6_9BACT|nr:hypothetical protein [Luteolibacter arcticus]MCW1924134.1 hypothetical protein [Luteolibacter arcticus]